MEESYSKTSSEPSWPRVMLVLLQSGRQSVGRGKGRQALSCEINYVQGANPIL